VVTLHAELTRALPWPSFHLLGEEELSALSRDTLLINASRGPVLDNAAMLQQLTRGEGPVTVLDVWEGEPAIVPDLLRNVTLGTPHIAGYSHDGKLLATRMLADSLAACFDLALPDAQGEAGLPPLKLKEPASGASLVRELLRARYRIEIDDKRLRSATLGAAPDEAARGFDRLRREYPERRELFGSALHGELRSEADRQLAQALGCRLEPASGCK
jgi:erythronate-4-phosphate dehydrogenase